MKVLSLFDGISCGRVALERAGIPVQVYDAYEIDKHAVQISQKNWPSIVHHGDVTAADFRAYQGYDLLIGGSPCQGFSFAGKQLNFNDERSKLYFDFERALKEVQPRYFLLKNVCMKQEYADVISSRLGVSPILINSGLVSAQNRKRLYWTNIPGIQQPPDAEVQLKDIIHERETPPAALDLDAYKVPLPRLIGILGKEVEKGKIQHVGDNVYEIHGRRVHICKNEEKQLPEPYLFGCITPDRVNKRQNGQRFNKGDKFYTLTAQDKHGVLIDGYLRKLTPIECERLQTLPDNYTAGVAESQRYKTLGNGWTVDVIAWILSHIPREDDIEPWML